MENNNNLLKWFNREASDENLVSLKETEGFKTIEKIVHYSSQIETPKVDVAKALENLKLKTQNTSKKGKVIQFNFKKLYKYAAAVVLLFTTSYFLLFNNNSSFKTVLTQTKSFHLPDNSEVVLNANSEISYVKKDWEKKRSVALKGEAYFKVQKGKKFTVHTSLGKVTVLGTQFNVKDRENYFEVKTYEGLVLVTYKENVVQLPKGSLFKVVKGIVDTTNNFDIYEKSWLQKESNFKSTPLGVVLAEIENQFDYKIETKEVDLDVLYTGGFAHTDINIALQSITIPLQLSYKIVGKKITLFNYGL